MMNGDNILVLRDILGHADLSMAIRYAPDHLPEAISLNPIASLTVATKKVEALSPLTLFDVKKEPLTAALNSSNFSKSCKFTLYRIRCSLALVRG
ncbi:hypothetical protein GAW91_001210 [Vibrio fluvialis]|nr:hypothetical protein [Vibrio fluvialis]